MKIVRILIRLGCRTHSESLFIKLKIMNIFQLHRYFTRIFVFKCISSKCISSTEQFIS